ncbi:MAG: flippase-like domain-containing protein [Dysgonamonadaceae bacterium]|jgi:uncharacterized protein (TIRG00374 family)|nr:flippase-like domain-containing protein [Dysgonamonadaceae bacterium]
MGIKIGSSLATAAKTIIPLLFGVIVLWLIIRQVEIDRIIEALKRDVDYRIILLSLPFGVIGNIFRALRWDLLIRPLGYTPRKSNLIYAVLGNYGVNLAVPRLGEIWRCTMISRYEKIPLNRLIGTMISDRIFDPIAVFVILVAAFAMNVNFFENFLREHPGIYSQFYVMLTSWWFYAVIAGISLIIFIIFKKYRTSAVICKAIQFISGIWEGVISLSRMKKKWLFVVHTVLIWASYFLYFYICFYAFTFTRDLGINCGFIAFGLSSIAMAVPVQGGMGAWHGMVIAVLVAFGVTLNGATAFAFLVHTVQAIIFTALFGLFGIIALPVANNRKSR